MDTFTRAFFVSALWQSCDEQGIPLLKNWTWKDINHSSAELMRQQCRQVLSKTWKSSEEEWAAGKTYWADLGQTLIVGPDGKLRLAQHRDEWPE